MNNPSSLATTISTIRLFEQFSSEDLTEFRNTLFQQLNVTSEVQFLSKVLTLCHEKLPTNTILNLNKKASKIFKDSNYPVIEASNTFNNLPDNMIKKLGEFLSEEDCVNLGYTHRKSYIDTQQRSFQLSRRHEDTMLSLELNQLKLLSRSIPTGLAFCYPYKLFLSHDDNGRDPPSMHEQNEVLTDMKDNQKRWSFFCDMFASLKCLILNQHVAGCAPVEALFNKESNVDLEYLKFWIDTTEFEADEESRTNRKISGSVSKFLSNYSNYFDSECNNELKQIRRLKTLDVIVEMEYGLGNELSEICKGLNKNFKKLYVSEGYFRIDSVESLKAIFHANLRIFSLDCNLSQLFVRDELQKMINSMDNGNQTDKDGKKEKEIEFDCKLDELSIDFDPYIPESTDALFDLTKILAFSGAAQNVHTFRLKVDGCGLNCLYHDEGCLQQLLSRSILGNLKVWEVKFYAECTAYELSKFINKRLVQFLKSLIGCRSVVFKNENIESIALKLKVYANKKCSVKVPHDWKDFEIKERSFDWNVFDGPINVEVKSDLSKDSIVEICKAIVEKSWITILKEGSYTLQLNLKSSQ